MAVKDVILLGLAPATSPAITYMATGGLDIGAAAAVPDTWTTVTPQTGTWTPVTPGSGSWTDV